MSESLVCEICFFPFNLDDIKPVIVCERGHGCCKSCALKLSNCPFCRGSKLKCNFIINRCLIEIVKRNLSILEKIPEIQKKYLKIESEPFGSGAQADIFKAKWGNKVVAVKVIRVGASINAIDALKKEAKILNGLNHPNIIRIYGTIKGSEDTGKVSIVMDYADGGNLLNKINLLYSNPKQAIQIALDIVNSLEYLHEKNIIHRDITPQNILLMNNNADEIRACLSDFGISRIMQTVNLVTSTIGTPSYSAPEILEGEDSTFGLSCDIYSYSMLLYHLFSGKQPFQGKTMMQIMFAVAVKKERPLIDDIDSKYNDIKNLIERGWSSETKERPKLNEFRNCLIKMYDIHNISSEQESELFSSISQSIQEQSTKIETMPVPSCVWDEPESEDMKTKRQQMIKSLKKESSFKEIFHYSVLDAMRNVYRHLFATNISSDVYSYSRSMKATPYSIESSPEIIAAQLSLVSIQPGDSVVIIGGKGGYIQSLIAQIVGMRGQVIGISGNSEVTDICKQRCDEYSPLSNIIKWRTVSPISDWKAIISNITAITNKVDSIIFTGAIENIPKTLITITNNSIIAPVGKDHHQKFIVVSKNKETILSDWGVVFGKLV